MNAQPVLGTRRLPDVPSADSIPDQRVARIPRSIGHSRQSRDSGFLLYI